MNEKALTEYMQQVSNMSLATSPFLPSIHSTRIKYPKAEVSGTGLDELYTVNNQKMLKLSDENKNYITENNQLKKVNEKLLDRIEMLNSIIEKEAAANTYYYNYPPKADDTLVAATKSKKTSADSEGQKVKKMYEDMMESQKKQYEAEIKKMKLSMTDEIEQLTQMFSQTSKDLIKLTVEHRALQAKFNEYY